MDAFWTVHPGVRDRVLTVQGALRPHVNLFVGPESVRFSGGLALPTPTAPRSRSCPRSTAAPIIAR